MNGLLEALESAFAQGNGGGLMAESAPAGGGLDDPKIQGLLTAGLAMLGSRGNFAQALSEGGLAGLQSMQQGRAFGQQSAMRDMQLQQQRMAMAEAQRKQQYLANLKAPSDDPQTAMLYDMVRNGFADPSALIKSNAPQISKPGDIARDASGRILWQNPTEVKEDDFIRNMRAAGVQQGSPEWNKRLQDWLTKQSTHQPATTISLGSPVPITMADGTQALVQPSNRPGVAPQIMRLPDGTIAAPSKAPPVEFTKSVTGIRELMNSLGAYSAALQKHGGPAPMAVGAKRAELENAFTAAQMGAKNAMELGALAGPDVQILNGFLVSPVDPVASLKLGPKGYAQQIEGAKKYLKNRARALYTAHGMKVPPEFSDDAPAAQDKQPGSPNVDDLLKLYGR